MTSPERTSPESFPRSLAVTGLAVGVWSALPPYVGPALDTETRVEVVDHVVPAVVLLVVSALSLWVADRLVKPTMAPLAAGMAVLLAGLWMTATHIPLVAQAMRDEVTTAAAAFHTAPGVGVTAVGVAWVLKAWPLADTGPADTE